MIDCLCIAIRTTIIELSVIHSRTSWVYIILERDSVEGRCMQMSDKFCVMHLKHLSSVSLHIVESSFVTELPHFKRRRSFGSSRNLPPAIMNLSMLSCWGGGGGRPGIGGAFELS